MSKKLTITDSYRSPETYYYDDTLISDDDFVILDHYEKRPYLHREDGPAYIAKLGEEWFQHGQFHRINGYADIWYKNTDTDQKSKYYLWGKRYSKEDYIEAMNYLKENGEIAFKLKYREI